VAIEFDLRFEGEGYVDLFSNFNALTRLNYDEQWIGTPSQTALDEEVSCPYTLNSGEWLHLQFCGPYVLVNGEGVYSTNSQSLFGLSLANPQPWATFVGIGTLQIDNVWIWETYHDNHQPNYFRYKDCPDCSLGCFYPWGNPETLTVTVGPPSRPDQPACCDAQYGSFVLDREDLAPSPSGLCVGESGSFPIGFTWVPCVCYTLEEPMGCCSRLTVVFGQYFTPGMSQRQVRIYWTGPPMGGGSALAIAVDKFDDPTPAGKFLLCGPNDIVLDGTGADRDIELSGGFHCWPEYISLEPP